MSPVKEHKETPGEELSNRPDKEFKVMITKMFSEFRRMHEHSEMFNKEVREYKQETSS